MWKSKKEKNKEEFLNNLSILRPKGQYIFIRARYLTECCNYPIKNAAEIANKEWNRLMEKVEKRKRYD